MKMKKLMTVLGMMIMLPSMVLATHTFTVTAPSGQTLYCYVYNGIAVVSFPGNNITNGYDGYVKPVGDLIIPETVSYNGEVFYISRIDTYAFYECYDLTSVLLPNHLVSIGLEAFGHTSISTITIPESVTTIVT